MKNHSNVGHDNPQEEEFQEQAQESETCSGHGLYYSSEIPARAPPLR